MRTRCLTTLFVSFKRQKDCGSVRDPVVERLRDAMHVRAVHLGTDVETGKRVSVPLAELQKTSTHIIGPAGAGKTMWLQGAFITELIRLRQPIIAFCPHPDLSYLTIAALRRAGTN